MKTVLLVHGGWSTSSAWDQLLPELDTLAVPYKTVDLPGHGTNAKSMWSVSLNDYADYLRSVAEEVAGPVVTLGHSAGGFAVTAAAGRWPDSFDELVYLAGFVPIPGERLMQLAQGDAESKLAPGVRPSPIRGHLSLHESVWHDALFHDCSEEDAMAYGRGLVLEPLRPGIKRIQIEDAFRDIPKSYVLCLNDQAVTTDYQRWMANRSNIPIAHELDCGHMPMLAKPKELAAVIAQLCATAAMGPKTKRLVSVLEQLEGLLVDYGESGWATQITKARSEMQRSDYHGVERLLSLYGGKIGSFYELFLGGSFSAPNGLGTVTFSDDEKRANDLLDQLRDEAYELANDISQNHTIGE